MKPIPELIGLNDTHRALLNDWQRDFPLEPEPFKRIGASVGLQPREVLGRLARLQAVGAFSRIGGVWAAGAGGAALLCAYAVPPNRLLAVAERVNALPGVNHNYEREDEFNLWFVLTGVSADALTEQLDRLDAELRLTALRLPMCKPYRIDLGFDLNRRLAAAGRPLERCAPPVLPQDRPLAAWLEAGLPLVQQPYHLAAMRTGRSVEAVLDRLQRWQDEGTLKRLGLIVRHHELGFDQNVMTVIDVPDDQVDTFGAKLATQAGVTLAYRRLRAPRWPYNLYAMVHGRSRREVEAAVHEALAATGLAAFPHRLLFSRQRFKQTGTRYFQTAAEPAHA